MGSAEPVEPGDRPDDDAGAADDVVDRGGAVVAGVGYAFGTFRWWRAYRHDPAAHEGGVSPRVLAALAVLAFLGFVALLVAA